MTQRIFGLFLGLLFSTGTMAQTTITQRLRGTVTDKDSHTPLSGVEVSLPGSAIPAVYTDSSGAFAFEAVPVGKVALQVAYESYNPFIQSDILVVSGRETVLSIALEESVGSLGEVTVRQRRTPVSENALNSARTFDVQETERYAGSRSDPARMASNYAGVQGADDSRNDIIVRGNSPQGLLWRLEDLDIPSPNHFSVPGTSGGPVSMLNSKALGTSAFYTGAFPSEFGNTAAGVFDLKFRNGNAERYEFSAQLGFLGTELAAEGPISKKAGSSFLLAYRYSSLALFEGLNIPIGTNSVPKYQDLNFKLHFPISKKGTLDFFGVGGKSTIDLIVSKLTEPSQELYGESDRDQYFTSNTGIAGASYGHTFSKNTYGKVAVGFTGNEIFSRHLKVFRGPAYEVDSLKDILGYDFTTTTFTGHAYINHRLSAKHNLRAGILANLFWLDYVDSSRQYPVNRQDWQTRLNNQGDKMSLLQAYAQYRWRPSEAWTVTAGLHAQYHSRSFNGAIEPRAGVRWRPDALSAVSLSYGLHSQVQPLYWYYAVDPDNPIRAVPPNSAIGFTRSHHLVAGYERSLSNVLRLRGEAYYQYLFDVPIEYRAGSSFSGLNQGSTFSRVFPQKLRNAGNGYNYGFELTLEKPFSHGYYLLFTGSVFDSKARGADGVYRNTDYNSRFALNALGGWEHKLGKATTLIAGGKLTYAGGRLYSPPDVAASNATGDFVVIDSLRNTLRFPDYFRADLKLGLRLNGRRLSHEIALDLVNVLGRKNLLNLTYSSDLAAQGQYPFYKTYQLGFLPLFYYRVDFGVR